MKNQFIEELKLLLKKYNAELDIETANRNEGCVGCGVDDQPTLMLTINNEKFDLGNYIY